jgi:FkbM family methyltransferase
MTPFNQTVLLGTRWGHMIALTCDPYQSGSLCMYGEWARAECDLLCSCLRPGDTALDVGANIGTMTVAMAKRVGPAGAVFAFEPQRLAFMCLCGNVALTHTLAQTRCFNVAVSDNNQPVQVPVVPLGKPFNVGGVRIGDPAYDAAVQLPREEVPCITLDELSLPRVDLMKLDVECMESKVLAGASDTVARCRPIIFAEALEDTGAGREPENLEAMLRFFDTHRYWAHVVNTDLFSADNIRFCPDRIFPGGDRNLIAFPREHPALPVWWLGLDSIDASAVACGGSTTSANPATATAGESPTPT